MLFFGYAVPYSQQAKREEIILSNTIVTEIEIRCVGVVVVGL